MELAKSTENCLCISSSVCARYIYLFAYKMTNHIFFSGRNIRKKCIVSRKSWYSMIDLAQNPLYFVFFPDIFNFDFSLNHSYLDLK